MEEILQLFNQLNRRAQSGATASEIKERIAFIQRLVPGFQVIYWSEMDSWVLIPLSVLPEKIHP